MERAKRRRHHLWHQYKVENLRALCTGLRNRSFEWTPEVGPWYSVSTLWTEGIPYIGRILIAELFLIIFSSAVNFFFYVVWRGRASTRVSCSWRPEKVVLTFIELQICLILMTDTISYFPCRSIESVDRAHRPWRPWISWKHVINRHLGATEKLQVSSTRTSCLNWSRCSHFER